MRERETLGNTISWLFCQQDAKDRTMQRQEAKNASVCVTAGWCVCWEIGTLYRNRVGCQACDFYLTMAVGKEGESSVLFFVVPMGSMDGC